MPTLTRAGGGTRTHGLPHYKAAALPAELLRRGFIGYAVARRGPPSCRNLARQIIRDAANRYLRGRADPRRPRALRRSGHVDAEARRRARRGSAGHRSGRSQLHRLRRRNRVPEHGPPKCGDRRGDQGAGRSVPAPVLHDRRLRAVRGGLSATRRAVALRWRGAALAPREHGRRGDRERSQDRALRRPDVRRSSPSTKRSTGGRCSR